MTVLEEKRRVRAEIEELEENFKVINKVMVRANYVIDKLSENLLDDEKLAMLKKFRSAISREVG